MNDDKLPSVKNNYQLKVKSRFWELNHRPLMPNASQLTTQLSEIYKEYIKENSHRKNKGHNISKIF
jgi:hypothetical protein